MVERDLAKVEAAGSSPVSRSQRNTKRWYPIGYHLFCVFEPRWDSKVRGLRSAPVVAKRTSTGCSATSRTLISKRVHVDIIFVFPIPRDSKVRGLRSAPVVAKRMSTGHSATSRALISKRVHEDIIFVFPIPPGLEGSRSPFHSGHCKTNVHRTFCNVSRSKRNTKKQRKYTENLACFRYKDKNFAEKDKMLCLLSRL